jgi:hypothetical protein
MTYLMEKWVHNSPHEASVEKSVSLLLGTISLTIILAAVIIHSWMSNSSNGRFCLHIFGHICVSCRPSAKSSRRKTVSTWLSCGGVGSAWTSIRFKTEFAALASVVSFIVLLCIVYGPYRASKTAWVVGLFFMTGMRAVVIQLCDLFVFYDRLKIVVRMPKLLDYFIHGYIFAIVFVPYLMGFVVGPFLVDTNTPSFKLLYYRVLVSCLVGSIIFNTAVSFKFVAILTNLYSRSNHDVKSGTWTVLASIARRSILHAILSNIGLVAFCVTPTYGTGFYYLLSILSMHFLFNVPGWCFRDAAAKERAVLPMLDVTPRNSREKGLIRMVNTGALRDREQLAMRGMMSMFVDLVHRDDEKKEARARAQQVSPAPIEVPADCSIMLTNPDAVVRLASAAGHA